MIPIRAPSGTTKSTPWSTGHVPYDLCTPTRLTTDISVTERTEPLGGRLERLERRQDLIDRPDKALEATEVRGILPELPGSLQRLTDARITGEPLVFEVRMAPGRHEPLGCGEPLLELEDPLRERPPRRPRGRNGPRHRPLCLL